MAEKADDLAVKITCTNMCFLN